MLTSALSRIRTRRSCTSSYSIRLTLGTHGRSIGHGPPTITVANRIQPGPTSMATSCLVVIPPFKAPSSTTSFLHGFGVAYSSISSRLSSSLPLNLRYSLFLGITGPISRAPSHPIEITQGLHPAFFRCSCPDRSNDEDIKALHTWRVRVFVPLTPPRHVRGQSGRSR